MCGVSCAFFHDQNNPFESILDTVPYSDVRWKQNIFGLDNTGLCWLVLGRHIHFQNIHTFFKRGFLSQDDPMFWWGSTANWSLALLVFSYIAWRGLKQESYLSYQVKVSLNLFLITNFLLQCTMQQGLTFEEKKAITECSTLKIDFSANFHLTHDFFWADALSTPQKLENAKMKLQISI